MWDHTDGCYPLIPAKAGIRTRVHFLKLGPRLRGDERM